MVLICIDLYERIEGLLQRKNLIESELAQPDVQSNAELSSILQSIQHENNETLTKFIGQFNQIESPPAGLEDPHNRIQNALVPLVYREHQLLKVTRTASAAQSSQSPVPTRTSPVLIDASPVYTPTSPVEDSQTLIVKGLVRRLIQSAKRQGSKWFQKPKD